MIRLHRLNGQEIIVNAELIESIESVPDTVINLYTNNRMVVKESLDEVYRILMEYKEKVYKPSIDNLAKSEIYNNCKK
ncbi:MAG: flagellar FlbD family protein [Endomicrobiales bacterium]|nr:flagellar FlbD family protein [Endomicrobiales bacterium]